MREPYYGWRCFWQSPQTEGRRNGTGSLCGGSPEASIPRSASKGTPLRRRRLRRPQRARRGIRPPASCSPRACGRRRRETTSLSTLLLPTLFSFVWGRERRRRQITSLCQTLQGVEWATENEGCRVSRDHLSRIVKLA